MRVRMMRKVIDRRKLYDLGEKSFMEGKPIDDFYNLPETWLMEQNRGPWEQGWRHAKDNSRKSESTEVLR